MRTLDTVAVVGAGAWGTALANAAALAGRRVLLWMRDPEMAAALAASRENARRLPGILLHPSVEPTADATRLGEADATLLVVPAQVVRQVCGEIESRLRPGSPLVGCAKGIERGTGLFMSEVVAEMRPGEPVGILSGPSFAPDVARGLPTAVTLACRDAVLAAQLAASLSGPSLRVYHGSDLRGVEIGGAAKNVLAIAAGIVAGRGLGESARAALVARGFAELMRFAAALGGRPETLMGLSGLGDLVLTCGSAQSRNFAFGIDLGRGLAPAAAGGGRLAEGVFTADALIGLARASGVEMPIAEAVAAMLSGQLSVDEAFAALMTRPLRSEV
ncbi:NAD(P)H-dependent glycerol-3-phosphate dehydrogenase [uncultured Enterovirga sp.]|uniref:NAD(P)H-dependent glycerol-3-phosphate dehydrogenase n=1 Tax=uncultured Enterovirga sp. TaxID=2026352 RepID=UPI0035CC8754